MTKRVRQKYQKQVNEKDIEFQQDLKEFWQPRKFVNKHVCTRVCFVVVETGNTKIIMGSRALLQKNK